jgi:hypothetical protein
MKRISILAALLLALCNLIGCGGATAVARVEGPTTSPWTEADDEALGITTEGETETAGEVQSPR